LETGRIKNMVLRIPSSDEHEGVPGGKYECQGEKFTEEGFVDHGTGPLKR